MWFDAMRPKHRVNSILKMNEKRKKWFILKAQFCVSILDILDMSTEPNEGGRSLLRPSLDDFSGKLKHFGVAYFVDRL